MCYIRQTSNGVNNEKIKNLLKDPKTNWKYIAFVAILAFIAGAVMMNYLSKQQGFEIPQITFPERKDETKDWKTYRNEEYGFEVRHPVYMELSEKKDEFTSSVWGPALGSVVLKLFEFRATNPVTQQEAEGISLNLRIYDIIDYRTSSYYFGKIGFDADNQRWFKGETGEFITEEYIIEANWPEEYKERYAGIPRMFMNTIEGVPVYEIFVYADVGESIDEYVLINNKSQRVFEFSKHSSGNTLDFSSKENQGFVDRVLQDFNQILSTFKFVE